MIAKNHFLLFGIILLICSNISQINALETSFPPTPAFKMINTTLANVTAQNYNDFISLEGIGVTITPNYLLKKITFEVTGGSDPNELYCSGTDKFRAYNATTQTFICDTDDTSSLGNATSLDDLSDVVLTAPNPFSILFYNGVNWLNQIFKLDSQTVVTGYVLTGIDNQTGDIITGTIKNPLLDGSNHTDTTSSSPPNRGDLITGSASNLWDDLPIGASGTVLKSDGTDASWGTVATPTVLAANVTSALILGAHTSLWDIPLTANSGNAITGVIIASSNTAGSALQVGANSSNANTRGWCEWFTPLTASTNEFDYLVVTSANVIDTGATTWLPAIEEPQPISFSCTVKTGSTAGNLRIFIQAEVASTVSAKAGSYYIKTP